MIQRVYERVIESEVFNDVLIATDDERIQLEAKRIGAPVVMTAETHPSGTDRCLEAYQKYAASSQVIVNVQGDEPFVDLEMLEDLTDLFLNEKINIATAVRHFDEEKDLANPSKVKAVLYNSGRVHSFSRRQSPIPADPELDKRYYKHIGVYAFRPETLEKISALEPSPSELSEKLEQLRWTDNGYSIHSILSKAENPAVDTPADLDEILKWMEANNLS